MTRTVRGGLRRYSILIVACVLATVLTGCGKADPRTAKLVGKWKDPTGSTFSLATDGSFSGDMETATLNLKNVPPSVHVAGTWWIDGKDFVFKVAQSSWKSDKLVGTESKERILSISENEYHTQDAKSGKYNDYTRVK